MKKLLLIGVGPGIGMALARKFGREGFQILLVARSADRLAEYKKELAELGISSQIYPADLTDTAGFGDVLQKILLENEQIDVMHYNASTWRPAEIDQIELDGFFDDFKTNVVGALQATQAVLPGMKSRKNGTLFFTGGGSALQATPKIAALGLGKAAMRHFVFSLAEEVRPFDLRAATVTVCGPVQAGTRFDPDLIAGEFWRLFSENGENFQTESMWN